MNSKTKLSVREKANTIFSKSNTGENINTIYDQLSKREIVDTLYNGLDVEENVDTINRLNVEENMNTIYNRLNEEENVNIIHNKLSIKGNEKLSELGARDNSNVMFQELGASDNSNVIFHELGNIVMLMNLSISKIEKDYKDIEENKYFKSLKEDTKQIVYLINSSKVNGKIYSIEKKSINVEKLIFNIATKYKEQCEKTGIKLVVNVEKKSKNTYYDLDEFKISRVIENITINAIEELELCNIEEKNININLCINKDGIVISINNNGRVIERDKIKEIFKPYITGKRNGNGIGLAFCEKIVRLHGGSIEVTSNKKAGTTFIIKL